MKRVPLRRKTPLKRGTSQLKRSRIKRKFNKNSVPEENKEEVRKRSGGRCEFMYTIVKTSMAFAAHYGVRCSSPADGRGPHHVERRRTRNHEPDNLLDFCPEHHGFVHAHPAWAYEVGYMRKQGKITREEENNDDTI